MAIDRCALYALSIALTSSVVGYPELSSDIPPRAGRDGPFVGAPFVAFLLPLTAVLIWYVFVRLDRASPAERSTRRAAAASVVFLSALHLTLLIGLIGAPSWAARLVGLTAGAFLVATGNDLPRLRPNPVWGIRTRQTLADVGLWRRVHRTTGYLRTLMGLGVCLAALAGLSSLATILGAAVMIETIAGFGAAAVLSRRKAALVVAAILGWHGASARASATELPLDAIRTLPAFVDANVPKLETEHHVSGTAVVIVHHGNVLLLQGYGKAAIEPEADVDPSRTLFRIGSVTKVFTAVAAVQLAEGGQLDWHRDVRQYVPEVRLRYGASTHQLLTHTAGLDERFAGAYTDSPRHLQPLAEHVREYMPEQLFRPGMTASYSNYNYALAGLVIERQSGRPYEDYLADRVFGPLQMTSTSAHQPPPPRPTANLAQSYVWSGQRYVSVPYSYTQATPAGSVTTTAADMGRFMMALLADRSLNGGRILLRESLRLVFEPQYVPHPRKPGWTYGFSPMTPRGNRLLYRGGTLGDQAASLLLFPDDRLGIFIASNSVPGMGDFLFEPMMAHLTGPDVRPEPAVPIPDAQSRAGRFAGTYRSYRQARHEMSRFRSFLPMSQVAVTAKTDGTIEWRGKRWVEVEPLLFRSADRGDYILFRENEQGGITGFEGYERLRWWEQGRVQATMLLVCVVAFLAHLLSSAIRTIKRVRNLDGRVARAAATLVAALNVVFVGGLILAIRDLGAITPLPMRFVVLLSLPLVSLGLTALLPAFAATAWREQWWTRRERLRFSTLSALAVVFLTLLNYWKLLGIRY